MLVGLISCVARFMHDCVATSPKNMFSRGFSANFITSDLYVLDTIRFVNVFSLFRFVNVFSNHMLSEIILTITYISLDTFIIYLQYITQLDYVIVRVWWT